MDAPRTLLLSLGLAAAAATAGPAFAQQGMGGVYIGQIDPTVQGQVRRTTTPNAVDQVLQSFTSSNADTGPTLMVPSGVAQGYANGNPTGTSQTNNLAVLNQYGTGNIGTITQSGGSGNTATATVNGNGNTTTQIQSGTGNASLLTLGASGATVSGNTATTNQSGDGNSSSYGITGNNNTLTSTQYGTGLSYSATIDGSGRNITIDQRGQGPGATTATTGLPGSNAAAISVTTRR